MDFANHWHAAETAVSLPEYTLRLATQEDAAAISRLARDAHRAHFHVDWRMPVDWLGSPHFVVAAVDNGRSQTFRSKLFGRRPGLVACLAAAADPPPAAWVRVAAVADGCEERRLLAEMLAQVSASLQGAGVTHLGWLVLRRWPRGPLPELGFEQINQIETYVKPTLDLPETRRPPGLHIRPVKAQDMAALAALEAEAFEPLWRFSDEALTLAHREAICFDVAEWNGRLVGYQLSSRSPEGAHLVRLTIAPALQGQGVGSALLTEAILAYRRLGLSAVSLNTQVDNFASQRLYHKFGFYATGEKLPVWCKVL